MIAKAGFPGLMLAMALGLAAGTMPAADATAQDDAAGQPVTGEPSATDEQPAADDPSVTQNPATTEQPATTELEASTQDPLVTQDDSSADEQSIIVAKPKPVVDESAPPVVSVVQVPRAVIYSTRGVVLPKILGSYR